MLYIKKRQRRLSPYRTNFYFIMLLLTFVAVVIGGYLKIQYLQPELQKFINRTYYDHRVLLEHRGNIYGSRKDFPLAMNVDEYHAIVEPHLLHQELQAESIEELTQNLSNLLEIPVTELRNKLNDKSRRFSYLKKNIPAYIAEKIEQLPQKSVRTEYKSRRFYPNGLSAAHIIGFTDDRGIGQGGIEYVAHQDLLATEGSVRLLRTAKGVPLRELSIQQAKGGNDWYLTIDPRLQYIAFDALRKSVFHHQALGGAAVVLDAQTGALLALANYPSFNPNQIRKIDKTMQNIALSHLIEPGSTIKPFVVAEALEQQKTKIDEVFPTAKPLKLGRSEIREERIKENLTTSEIIQRSSNIGVIMIGNRLGEESVWGTFDRLGFSGSQILGLREEQQGSLQHYENWQGRDFFNHTFGYGFSTNLLQLARAYSVFTTGGMLLQPYLEMTERPSSIAQRVFSVQTSNTMSRMLEAVVEKGGTGANAAVPGYRVAGKTGTVEKVVNGQYDNNKMRALFVGFAPVSNPKYVIAVMIDEPKKNGQFGGQVAAPVFSVIMKRALLYGGVTPDGEYLIGAADDV